MSGNLKFYGRLQAQFKNFCYEEALQLSREIHDAECNGYEVPPSEDRLWEKLTYWIVTEEEGIGK
jgi:hypothetical protein